jgi:uncharacterized tellurite resistance protein B-like protein
MAFMKFLGVRAGAEGQPLPVEAETEAVRQIVSRLEALPPDQARLLAGMAYVLSRAANSDMTVSEVETEAIAGFLVESGLDRAQAMLVTEMAKLQELATGGTSDYLVTREFRQISTPEQRVAVLRGCYLVAAADETIGAMEIATLREIASELDVEKTEADAVRAEFADRISARFRVPETEGAEGAEGAPNQPEAGS